MTADSAHRETARAMLDSIRLRESEIARHLDCAMSIEYWRSLVPELSVCAATSRVAPVPIDVPDASAVASLFEAEGIVRLPPVLDAVQTERMRSAVVALMRADWPPVFAW